jgi:glycosyltransferase involved in cell wall biosynthesis
MEPAPHHTRARVPRLLVDIQTVQGGFFGNRGIRRYALGLSRALLDRRLAGALLLNPGRPWLEELPPELRDVDEITWTTRRRLRDLDDGAVTGFVMTSPFERTSPPDAALPSYVVESGIPIIAVLYDLIPEIVDVYPPSLMSEYEERRELIKDVDLVLTLSEHVRGDAMRRLGMPAERVSVIGAAVSGFFRPALPGERPVDVLAERAPGITRPFALSVTGWLAHKNVERLIEAWSRQSREVRRSHQLVLTCPLPPGGEEAWNELAVGLGLRPGDVVVTGRVDDVVLRALYQRAELLVLPSFEEGFGLPVLEAARCGCPAITSSASSLPEVLDWAPSTFPPHHVDTMAATIERGVLDPVFRADLRAAGDVAAQRHTWDRVAERTVQACDPMPAPRRARRTPPPRLALVGRLTPPTAAAASVDRVADALDSHCDVETFDTAAGPGGPSLGDVRDPWGYDAIVYVVDSSPDEALRDLIRAYPGVVWFVESADHIVATDLARHASLVVHSPDVPALAVDPGPFERAVPSTTMPQDGTANSAALLEAFGVPAPEVRQPTR